MALVPSAGVRYVVMWTNGASQEFEHVLNTLYMGTGPWAYIKG